MGRVVAPTHDLGLSFKRELLNAEYAAWRADHCSALEHARNVGRMLCEAKDRLLHGQWKPWLDENFDGKYDQAQVAMQVYGAWLHDEDSLKDADGQLPRSIRGTLSAIRRGRQQKNEPALAALNNAQVDDDDAEPQTLYTHTFDQLAALVRAGRESQEPVEPWLERWLAA